MWEKSFIIDCMRNETSSTGVKKGRPRSESSRRAILDATLRLTEEYGSIKRVTIDAIAKRAGVGKQTIYKWWGNTSDILLEILKEVAGNEIDIPSDDIDLTTFLTNTFQALKPTVVLILKSLMAESVLDATLREKYIDQFIFSRRTVLMKILEQSSGLIIEDQSLLMDFIFGLIWYRLLVTNVVALDADDGAKIARILMEKS
jgi:AcrR family transcriptional regulator